MKYHQALGYHYVAARGAIGEHYRESRSMACIKKRTSTWMSFCKNGDGSAEPQHCLRRRDIYVPKGVIAPYNCKLYHKKEELF